MASDVHFKFCFKCAEEVVVGDALIFCENCVLKIDPKDPSALSTRVDEMKFCYICGKQLYRGKKYLICRDGCTLCIPLQPETESGTRDDIETNKGNQYEDKPEILYSTPIVISEPVPQRVAQYPLTGVDSDDEFHDCAREFDPFKPESSASATQGEPKPNEILVITMDDQDAEALSTFLVNHGLTDPKWVSCFHEHDITKPDQIPVKGNEELYMTLSSRGNAQENADLKRILGIEKPADSIHSELANAGLEPSFWSAMFAKQLGVTSIQALQHVGGEEYQTLQQFAHHQWEKKALKMLLKIDDEESTFQQQHERQSEKLESAQAEKERERLESAQAKEEREMLESRQPEEEKERLESRQSEEESERLEGRHSEEERERLESRQSEEERERLESRQSEEESERLESRQSEGERERLEGRQSEEERERLKSRQRERVIKKVKEAKSVSQSTMSLHDDQDNKKKLFSKLGLTDFFPQKLTLRDALEIREDVLKGFHQGREETITDPKNDNEDAHKRVQCTDPKLFPFLILQKIMAFDYNSRTKLICSSLAAKDSKRVRTDEDESEDDDDNDNDGGTMTIHPMDGLLALLHCSDNFLRQDLFSRLATCQLAIPLLMPDPFAPQITFPLWAMRSIIREWKSTQASSRTVSHEEPLISYRAPLVSFMRFGKHNVSKSHILNSVISESKHDYFFHFNCDGGSAERLLVGGLVEVCWYLPSDDIFPDVVSFANLHGDARQFSKQVSFLSKVSFMNFVFLNEEDLDSKAFQVLKELATAPGGLVVLRTKPTADKKTWRDLSLKLVPRENFSVIKLMNKNEAEITNEVCRSINKALNEKWTAAAGHCYTFEEFSNIAHTCNEEDEELAMRIIVDEEENDCARGKELADGLKKIIDEFISEHPDDSTKELLPLQSRNLWHKWAFSDKEQYRHTLRGHCGIEEYSAQKREEMKQIRSQQFDQVQQLTPLMKSFIQCILSRSTTRGVRKYFLHWLQLILDNLSREQLPHFRNQYQEKRRKLLSIRSEEKVDETAEKRCRDEIDELNNKLINASFGLEHLLRETCQIYEAICACSNQKHSSHKMFCLPAIAAELMIDGYPLELMDGDAAHVPKTWVLAVLQEVQEILKDPRILVLSILGLQGTGKSTLMNTLFGLRFSVSAGRCTRGAFMQLLPVHDMLKQECKYDYLLIVDTEGLRAPELDYLQTQKHDNELATFIIGLANLTVINIFGETTGDLDDVLQTAVHAFLRMKEVKLTSSCQFVHQNVTAVMAGEKGLMGRINFKEKLNEMTQAAAKEENLEGQYRSFRQIIKFNEEDDVYHFPGLWKGDPPMAPVNPGYSKKAQEMKLQLIKFAKAKPASESVNHLSVFQAHMKELWKAILHENFVFSFKNTIEIVAYNTLDAKYVQLSWTFQQQMMQWEQKAQNELRSCPRDELLSVYEKFAGELPRHVREIYQSLKEDLKKWFEESPEREIMAKWKTETEIRLSTLQDQLKTHAESHCRQLSTNRQALAKADEMKASHRKRILEHVKELASQLEQGKLNDRELNQRFNEQWIIWIAELRAIPVHLTRVSVPYDIEKSLSEVFYAHNAMVIQKLTERPLQEWGSPLKLKIVSESHMQAMSLGTRFGRAIGYKWAEKCSHAQKVTDHILEHVQKYLTEKQNENYNPSFTNELLRIVKEEIDEFNANANEFKFTPEYTVDIALTACGCALKKFKLMVEAYRKKIDPVEYIEHEMRERLLVLFKNQYFQVTQEKAAAVTLCDLLSKSLKQQVISLLSHRIVDDMRGKSPHFQSKPTLKTKILIDIGEELNQNADFAHCSIYLTNIKRSLQWWIKHYTRQHCEQGEPSRLVQLGAEELSALISCISQTADEVTQDVSPEQEEFSINDWLTKFHGKLQGRLEIDVTELRDLGGVQQLKDVHYFNEEVFKNWKPHSKRNSYYP